ncbi:MAG: hypothetical protein ABIS17_05650 [Casimicrobiaceae bacterium]
MKKIATAIIAGTFLCFAGVATSADVSNAVKHPVETTKAKVRAEKKEERMEDKSDANYKVAKADIDAKYKSSKAACKDKKGADERACVKEAKAEHNKAMAAAKATRTKEHAEAHKAGEIGKVKS